MPSNVALIGILKEALTEVKYDKDTISAKLAILSEAHLGLATQIDELAAWLLGEIKG